MRTFLMISITVFGIAVIVGFYVWMQPSLSSPSPAVQEVTEVTPLPPPPPPSTMPDAMPVVQEGANVWVKVYDEKTKQLAWQFRAAKHDPRPDNSDYLTAPEAEFYFNNGEIVHIEGTHGRVMLPGEAARRTNLNTPMSPPTRGELYDVTIKLYHASNLNHPVLVCKMNNVAFDNDTFRIATGKFTRPDGTVVEPDQVPVEIRGDEYDFDGKGLVIRWNDRDRKLQSLEVAHGDSMTIKQAPAEQQKKSPAEGRSVAKSPDAARPRQAVAPAADATKKNPPVAYRAKFEGGVVVTQDGKQLAEAEKMNVDFMVEEENPAEPAAPVKKSAAPTTRRPAARTAAAVAPATGPLGDAPIVVRWPGKLLVVPLEESLPRLKPGQRNIEMISEKSPVVLNYRGSLLSCASFVYGASDNSLLARSSPLVPTITMKDASGAILYTQSLNYSGSDDKAMLEGASRAEIPIHNEQTKIDQLLTARWSKSCVLTMTGSSPDEMSIEQAEITGDVDVNHPQIALKSQTLRTDFTPVTDKNGKRSAQIKQLTAGGDVKCDLVDQAQKKRHINAEHLTLMTTQTPDGQLIPREMIADGTVHSFDDEQDLRTEHLAVKFAPATRPNDPPQVSSVFAQQDVKFAMKDMTGKCDQLDARAVSQDEFNVKLSGQPFASATTGNMTLSGPIINMRSNKQNAAVQVVGAGTIHGLQQETPQSKPTPFDVSWGTGLNMDGASNHVDADGGVAIVTKSADGTVNTAAGNKLSMELMDDPRGADRPAKPAAQPADGFAGGFDSLGKKVMKSVTLQDNVEVKSILADAAGQPLRRMHLFGPILQSDSQSKQVVMRKPGRMLYEDRRPSTRPATGPAQPMGDLSGATAFEWDKQFIYDQQRSRAEMTGNVVVVHQDNGTDSDPFRLESQRVMADFAKAEKSATLATEKRTQDPGMMPDASQEKLKMLTADGGVRFISRQIQFDAEQMTFDPEKELLVATGSPNNPVQLYDEKGVSLGYFQQVSWNTKTQQISLRDVQARIRR